MDKRLISRRNILVATISAIPGIVLSSAAFGMGAMSSSLTTAKYRGGRNLGMPSGATLQIESLDTRLSSISRFGTVNIPFGKIFGFREHTVIPAPYYFDVDIDKQSVQGAAWNYTVNLYDTEGNDIGSITTSNGGTGIFVDQQVLFRIHANFN